MKRSSALDLHTCKKQSATKTPFQCCWHSSMVACYDLIRPLAMPRRDPNRRVIIRTDHSSEGKGSRGERVRGIEGGRHRRGAC